MSKISRRGLRTTAAAVAAGAAVIAGGALAATAQAAPLSPAAGAQAAAPSLSIRVPLTPMPQGTVTLGRDHFGTVDAAISAFGLTPGSAHAVDLVNRSGRVITSFGTLTANTVGQAHGTLDSRLGYASYTRDWGSARVVVLNGTAGDRVSREPIAQTQYVGPSHTYRLIPVEVSQFGFGYGTPQGQATISYNPVARTISVTVNASGLTPGAHAAHIHVGSCESQGPVQYMLMDFTANSRGQIVHETRTVTNVTTPPPATGYYLNLHQGTSNNILDSAGNPTINFRPLLCGNIVP